MEARIVAQELAASNPWWSDPDGWASRDRLLRAADRSPLRYRPEPLRALTPGGLHVLRGPRRVGKSTAIRRCIEDLVRDGVDPRRIVHVSVDGWRADDLLDLVRQGGRLLHDGAGPRYWFIDEVSSVLGPWPERIKALRDTDARFGDDTVVLTGSSAARLDAARKAFAGRARAARSDRLLLPMGLSDVLVAFGVDVPPDRPVAASPEALFDHAQRLAPWWPDVDAVWRRHVRLGGYPEVVEAAATSLVDTPTPALEEDLWRVVVGDALDRSRISPTQVASLLGQVVAGLGRPLSVAHAAREADVATNTARDRLEDLRRAFLLWEAPKEREGRALPRAQSKWFFLDPGIAVLAARRARRPEPSDEQLVEQQVGVALLRWRAAIDPAAVLEQGQVRYHQARSGAEVDFVLSEPPMGVEVKDTDRIRKAFETIGSSSASFGIVAARTRQELRDDGAVVPQSLLVLGLERLAAST